MSIPETHFVSPMPHEYYVIQVEQAITTDKKRMSIEMMNMVCNKIYESQSHRDRIEFL